MDIHLPEDFFLTSDTWFGRNEILNIANRPFANIGVMNNELITRWNNTVKKDDVVIHLGNFAWDTNTIINILPKLHGKIYFMLGNADDALDEIFDVLAIENKDIDIIENEILTLPNHDLILCHYPLDVWNGKATGTVHAHGHTVFSHKTNLGEMKRINVCCDFWNYAPIKYSVLKDFINIDKL